MQESECVNITNRFSLTAVTFVGMLTLRTRMFAAVKQFHKNCLVVENGREPKCSSVK